MGKSFSLLDYIQDNYYNMIFNELSTYVEVNPDNIGCSTFNVYSPDEATLDSLELHKIRIKQGSNNWLFFDIVGIAQLEIAETVKRERETDGVTQWFKISCSAHLMLYLVNFLLIILTFIINNGLIRRII